MSAAYRSDPVDEERAAIVAWLRELSANTFDIRGIGAKVDANSHAALIGNGIADAIERRAFRARKL